MRVAARVGWAVLYAAADFLWCSAKGHPGAIWRDGVRRCRCGKHWT